MMRWLAGVLLAFAFAAAAQAQVVITADLNHLQGPYHPIYNWFGYDEANYTTMPDGRKLLGELHDLTHETVHIRVHHLLTSGDGVPDLKWSSTNIYTVGPDGKPRYNFTILDGIFDAFKAAGVQPMVELGFMPKDLTVRPDPYYVKFPANTTGGSNDPPKSYAQWGELARVLTAHLVDRYGRDEVRRWYFEVWNEPNGSYWHASPEDYYKLYDYAAAGVKEALPEAMVGGPATTGPSVQKAATFLDRFLEHCRSGRSAATGGPVPLDFISFHVKGRANVEDGHLSMLFSKEMNDAEAGFRIILKYPAFAKLPVILSEADPEGCAACSAKVPQVAEYRNGTVYPAYTAAAMKALLQLAQRSGIHLLSMISWSFEFENRPPFEGFRALATDGIDKPVLNFFRMAGMMSGERVETTSSGAVPIDTILKSGIRSSPDIDALATRSRHEAAVMVWNYSDTGLQEDPGGISLVLSGIPAKRVKVEQYRIDQTHSNAYSAWKRMGSPASLSPEQRHQLEVAGQLQVAGQPAALKVNQGRLTLPVALPGESVALFKISW